jgi:UPF0176 protein
MVALDYSLQNNIAIISFYRFVNLPDFAEIRNPLKEFCATHNIKGTILLSHEGINGTISGERADINAVLEYLNKDSRLNNLEYKENTAKYKPFGRIKVHLKKEIVRMGVENLDATKNGEYVSAKDWDNLIEDEEVLVIDTRNDYEIMLGTFKNAISPNTKEFREFPKWANENLNPKIHKKIAMFCTGGVRCEKSTAYLKSKGFEQVYHLKGGILQYLEDTKNQNHKWQGECFVFDERIAVNDKLEPSRNILCKKCSSELTMDEIRWGLNNRGVVCSSCKKG